ncbi:MAG: type II toxin-antitoxin system RelE/ParE family toxin [Bdellovibrionaceae bacterium]|nr:type II toxin-antitoxin system RelE/ParE family toxin [Pseudobdellovibrionaceae bacterium]
MREFYRLLVYVTPSGREPFGDWLDALDGSVRGKVMARVDRLMMGHPGHAKPLGGGLNELKLKNPAFRIYYSVVGMKIVLLLSAGDKSAQTEDIRKARAYLEEYRGRDASRKKDR